MEEVPSFANIDLLCPVYVTGSKHSESNLHPSSIVLPSALPQLSPCGSVIANGYAGVNVCILIPHASDPLQPEGIILALADER